MNTSGKLLFTIKSLRPILALATLVVFISFGFPVTSKAQSEKFDYIFQEAVRQKQAGHTDIAFDLYDYCLKLNPKSGAALYELSSFYNTMKQDTTAINYLKKACELYPNNYWYNQRLVMMYLRNRRTEEALVTVEDMAQRFPEKTDVLMMLLDLYENKKDYANMIKVLDKVEVKEGKSEQLSMEKFQIYLRLDDEKHAFEEMEDLAKEYPNDLRYKVVLADLYRDAKKKNEAVKLYKEVEAKDSMNVTLLLSLSNFYREEGNEELYQKYLTKLVTSPNLDNTNRARMMASLIYENLNTTKADSSALLTMFDKVLELPQETTEILELKLRYMATKKMSEEQIKPLIARILEVDPEHDMARQQLLQYAIEKDDPDAVIEVCKPAVEYRSKEPLYYYYIGVSYMRKEDNKKALEAMRQCLDRVGNAGDNKVNMIVNANSLMAELYHQLGQDDKAFLAYDSVLIYRPNDAMALNNYAYYLSLNKKNMTRAEEMSRKAIELEPDNATYLDTYAWVLFQMKRYDEAKEYMDKVVELIDPEELKNDSDIKEHIVQINKKVKNKK